MVADQDSAHGKEHVEAAPKDVCGELIESELWGDITDELDKTEKE